MENESDQECTPSFKERLPSLQIIRKTINQQKRGGDLIDRSICKVLEKLEAS